MSIKILDSLLDVRPFGFALDVAALASRREYLNLDKWLTDNVLHHGAEFLHAVIAFLDEKMQNEKTSRMIDPSAESRTMSLSPNTITIILRMLRNKSVRLPRRLYLVANAFLLQCHSNQCRRRALFPRSPQHMSPNPPTPHDPHPRYRRRTRL